MNIQLYTLIALSLLALLGCRHEAAHPAGTDPIATDPAAGGNAMAALADMREGNGAGRKFPEVVWGDVPALLDVADSTRALASFPANPLSSQLQSRCTEGVMALWMVESVRRARPLGFPSLNPLLLGGDHEGERDWNVISESNQAVAVEAYRAWWQRVKLLTDEERANDDPLAGLSINWH